MPWNTNGSHAPPTGAWRMALIAIAMIGTALRQLGKPGKALEAWALKHLGVWPK
jgi:hypothetical protein